VTFQGNAVQRLQVEFYHALVLLVRAWRVGGDIGGSIACLDEFVLDEITFDLFAADVGKYVVVDYDTRRKRLPTLGFHFPAESRVLNNILLGVGQVVFGQNSANTGAPATIGFQIRGNFWLLHWRNISQVVRIVIPIALRVLLALPDYTYRIAIVTLDKIGRSAQP
jgi:hypothetical protein